MPKQPKMKKLILLMLTVGTILSSCSNEKTEQNPLLIEWNTPFGIPPFDQINASHFMPAYEAAFVAHKAEIDAIVNNSDEPTFENTIAAYDGSGKLLSKIDPVFGAMYSGITTPELQAIATELSPKESKHNDDIRLNPVLFSRIKAVYEKRDELNLTAEQMRLLTEMYKGFVRSGANLSEADQVKLRELNSEISALQLAFGQNMLSETGSFKLVIDNEADLKGLPADLIAAAAKRAEKDSMSGKWVFGLDNPSIMPFLQFSENAALRKQLLDGYLNRCNNGNDKDNKEIIKKLVSLRLERAKLMGYTTAADFILETRCAKNSSNVYGLLDKLWAPTIKVAEQELTDIKKMAAKDGIKEVGAGDWRYYAAKAKNEKFALNDEELAPYFQREKVREGMFYVANKLYGITFTKLNDVPTLVPEQEVFEVKEADGTHVGVLFDDTFARPGQKNGGAWCSGYRDQTYENGVRVAPLVTITCNFSTPIGDNPSLLTPDEANTYFHEFGHALAALLVNTQYLGTSNYPRDFVELPSQIMEHWVFEPEVLKVYAKHYQTGEVIPSELIEKIDKSGKYGQGFATAEYLAASLLDMDYHVLTEVKPDFDVTSFENDMLYTKRTLQSQIPPRYRSTYFSHTMGGGYTAGYYSYLWAEVLDCDAYQAFVDSGNIFDPATATKFRKEILERGGQDDAMVLYTNFRGQEPIIEPLLKNRGLL